MVLDGIVTGGSLIHPAQRQVSFHRFFWVVKRGCGPGWVEILGRYTWSTWSHVHTAVLYQVLLEYQEVKNEKQKYVTILSHYHWNLWVPRCTYMNKLCRKCYNLRLPIMTKVQSRQGFWYEFSKTRSNDSLMSLWRIRAKGGLEELEPSLKMRKAHAAGAIPCASSKCKEKTGGAAEISFRQEYDAAHQTDLLKNRAAWILDRENWS